MSAEKILLPKEARYPLGRTIGKAAIDAKLIGNPAFGQTPSRTLEAWRDAGGTLEVRRLDLVWGKFDLSGEGTVALDNALQPIVAMTASVLEEDELEREDAGFDDFVPKPVHLDELNECLQRWMQARPTGDKIAA